jgi:succinylarginine dihydrolase
MTHEINFDGLVGPTHNYAALAVGNLASAAHGLSVSNPKEAALQGLAKMKFMMDLGVKQGVLPPHERPFVPALRSLGFGGSDREIVQKALKESPLLLRACSSASAMWAANAAVVSPSSDCADGKVHFTPANLAMQLHRSIEANFTSRVLRAYFPDPKYFAHHEPLYCNMQLSDEGAANHMRLAASHEENGIEIFVYGRKALAPGALPSKFPARQTFEASDAIARLHQLSPARTFFIQQSPAAIDAGAFHNDVVAVSNENVLFYHASAYVQDIADYFPGMHLIKVSEEQVPLADAIKSYLFNSQLVTLGDGGMVLICPSECEEVASTREYLKTLPTSSSPIHSCHFIDVRQSMKNGGGPACLRLRVVVNDQQMAALHPKALLTNLLYEQLVRWVLQHYRDKLHPDELGDPQLLDESRAALDDLSNILQLGSIYDFQKR